jgi:hypothetical protein
MDRFVLERSLGRKAVTRSAVITCACFMAESMKGIGEDDMIVRVDGCVRAAKISG